MGCINLDRGYLFIHVPKCAGTSITGGLLRDRGSAPLGTLAGLAEIMRQENEVFSQTVANVEHARARDVRRLLGKTVYDGLYSFAVVRNPWDRFKSFFRYAPQLRTAEQAPLDSFSEFIDWVCRNDRITLWDRICDREGNVIVNNVLRFENLESEIRDASDAIGFDIPLSHKNKSAPMEIEPYSEKMIEKVQQRFARDLETFGYPARPGESCNASRD